MTPAARVQTAIECLDRIADGEPAERVLTTWGRKARHAGSKDRAAVRDIVFGVLRRWWSSAAFGGGQSGRARMIGYLRATGQPPEELFTGDGYGPAPLVEGESLTPSAPERLAALDCPAWLAPQLETSLGADFEPVMAALQSRAPVFLRVNAARGTVAEAQAALGDDGIETVSVPLSPTALEVLVNPRRIQGARAYLDGLVELQDAASQAVVDMLPLQGVTRILDFCAGGGGKSLALAARTTACIDAHDVDPRRLSDLPARADRAGARIGIVPPTELSPSTLYDLVLVDAPCSGSGAWRRSPEGKIRLTHEALARLSSTQDEILDRASDHVAPGGFLAYATCSLLNEENRDKIDSFVARSGFVPVAARQFTPLEGGDGFFCAIMTRD